MLNFLRKISQYSDIVLAITIVGTLLVLLFPIPTAILDTLLACSITASIIILITTLFIKHPLELSVFPTLLLVTTIIRLSLNIASTRLILSRGHFGPSAAGHVIEAFGRFVMQGNVVIGIIVFIILTIINFIVITKGSGRIAEVAARFSLDAMPGKQMAIDADLSAGIIKEQEARTRRKQLEEESTFYGAMDGANKFVRGDAIAGLIITFINLIGGIIVGMLQKGLVFDVAVNTYTVLTIGDGLVTQIPSLVISLAAGLLVTKSGSAGSTDKEIFGQLGRYPQALWISSALTGLLALVPGLPFLPFCLLSIATGTIGYIIQTSPANSNLQQMQNAGPEEQNETEDQMSEALKLDIITIELGFNILPILNFHYGPKLTDQIKTVRYQLAKEYGFVLPSVRIRDNIQLDPDSYVIKIKEFQVGSSTLFINKLLAINPHGNDIDLPGQETVEPSFGLPAKWIDPTLKYQANEAGYSVIEAAMVLITHLTELAKENITELLSYSETQKLIDDLAISHAKLVKDLVPEVVSISMLQKILQMLLAELVSIRDLPTILEAIADAAKQTKNILKISEIVRERLARQICYTNSSPEGYIMAVQLSERWEQIFVDHTNIEHDDVYLTFSPSQMQEFIIAFKKVYDEHITKGYIPVLVTSSRTRIQIKRLLDKFRSGLPVLSYNELHSKFRVQTVAIL